MRRIPAGVALACVVAAVTAGAWRLSNAQVLVWAAPESPKAGQLRPEQIARVVDTAVWRDTVRYLGPVLALTLAVLTRRRADALKAGIRRLGEQWGRFCAGVMLACLAAMPIGLVAGVRQAIHHLWTYRDLQCPPGIVMESVSPAERAAIETACRGMPPTARIFLVSDQNPWFLNYYLHPRTLFRLHDEWQGPRKMPLGWLDEKRIRWILERTKDVPYRLTPRSEYEP